jgi:ribosome-associated toxin RatA of RatAB toxin-antitoxin module
MIPRLLESVAEVKRLAEFLSQCEAVTLFDTDDAKEAWTLAHCFADLEMSFRAILDQHLPALLSDRSRSEDETEELLHAIGEEFRHILYHLKDPRYYRYLLDDPGKR